MTSKLGIFSFRMEPAHYEALTAISELSQNSRNTVLLELIENLPIFKEKKLEAISDPDVKAFNTLLSELDKTVKKALGEITELRERNFTVKLLAENVFDNTLRLSHTLDSLLLLKEVGVKYRRNPKTPT